MQRSIRRGISKSSYVFICHFISQSFASYVFFFIQIMVAGTVFSYGTALALLVEILADLINLLFAVVPALRPLLVINKCFN